MAGVKNILEVARICLGDLEATRYTEVVIRIALGAALSLVNKDLGSNLVFSTASNSIDPIPTNFQSYLISLAIVIVLLSGEENASVLDGGGAIWRSGLSSISLASSQNSMASVVKRVWERYEKAIELNRLGAEVYELDMYQIGDIDMTQVN
jgi:hypothetical protein